VFYVRGIAQSLGEPPGERLPGGEVHELDGPAIQGVCEKHYLEIRAFDIFEHPGFSDIDAAERFNVYA